MDITIAKSSGHVVANVFEMATTTGIVRLFDGQFAHLITPNHVGSGSGGWQLEAT